MFRYCYHNVAYRNSGARHGIYCNPIKKNGKCIVGKPGNQFIEFEDGTKAVVVRRGLRLVEKCKQHKPTGGKVTR